MIIWCAVLSYTSYTVQYQVSTMATNLTLIAVIALGVVAMTTVAVAILILETTKVIETMLIHQ